MSFSNRPHLHRSTSWPPTVEIATDAPVAHVSESGSVSATTKPKPDYDPLYEDLEAHPEDHFLSPMYEYEEWASDSDDDGEEVEWDAGITDFALFDSDRRRAQETNGQLDNRWEDFVLSQQEALKRAVRRTEIDTTKPPLPVDDLPDLTPDDSPNLKDDLEFGSTHATSTPRTIVPNYLTVTVTPPSPEQGRFDDEDDLPLSFHYRPGGRSLRHETRKVQRPGLRHARTMSGKVHSWKRPSWKIYSVGEDVEAEKRAEQNVFELEEESERGRRGSR